MKNLVSMANGGINIFLIVIHRFSLVKAALNALRVCKLRKNCLPALTSVQWCYLNAFMIVNYRKEKKYIQSEQQIFTAHIYIGCLIVNYKTRRCSDTLKSSQRMGDRRIFLKPSAPLSLMIEPIE
jgi:hypothetical protein